MRWRTIVRFILLAIVLIGIYNVALLVVTSAKLFGYGAAFDLWRGTVERETVTIGTIPTDVYASSRSKLPLLLIHGVNATGKDGPEISSVAEAFAGSGFRVFVPEFERLTRQNVTPADIDDVVFVFQSLNSDGGIVCASYGCGPALVAATRPEIRDRVRFVVTFGAYFDLTETLRFIITSPPSPLAYSKWMYMAANSDLIQDLYEREQLVAIAAERRDHGPEDWTLSGLTLGQDARAMLELYESETPAQFDTRLVASQLVRDRTERLSPSRYLDGMRAQLIIVHISSDPCISSMESIRMAEAAKSRGIPYNLTIMDMYGHTRPAWPVFGLRSLLNFYLPESFKFLRVLNRIISYA